jgi:DNA adenine methylase
VEGTYFEPFLGSGAVFFRLRAEGRLRGPVVLSDANEPLVETWRAVQGHVDEVIDRLEAHRTAHNRTARHHYYAVRKRVPKGLADRAARFIYLNKTCYNGLWRVNRAGRFNVPMGRYSAPPILDAANLRAASEALQGVRLRTGSYSTVLNTAKAGDVVYLDPPYHPLSRTANFTGYTRDGFDSLDQLRLAVQCGDLRERGVRLVLSNRSNRALTSIYRFAGLRVTSTEAPRSISCVSGSRGTVLELLASSNGRRVSRSATR